MKIRAQHKLALLTCGFFVALSANAAAKFEFSDWDSDGNDMIEKQEWMNNCQDSDLFGAWDNDQDGLIDDDEFSTGLFRHWDEDGDGVLDESEWTKANESWFSEYKANYNSWDTDEDGFVEYQEFGTAFGKTDYFSDWDDNNTLFIESEDFCQGLFNTADTNDDDSIQVGEYEEDSAWYAF